MRANLMTQPIFTLTSPVTVGTGGGGDEGCTNIRVNGGNDANREGAILVNGTPTPGATTITYSGALNPDDIMVGGFLIDTQGPSIYTGNITAYDPTQHLLTLSQPPAPWVPERLQSRLLMARLRLQSLSWTPIFRLRTVSV